MNDETPLWKSSSSQWLNLWHFSAAIILAIGIVFVGFLFPPALAALVIPAAYALWRYLVVRTRVFEFSCQRLRITWGVINQHIDEIELYRVKDSLMSRTWWMRLTGLATISLETSDRSLPTLVIPAIPRGQEMRELIRKHVELQRDKKRVREMDFDDVAGSDTF